MLLILIKYYENRSFKLLFLRHEIFDRWLSEKKSVAFVLEFLADANFDPEFYNVHEAEIVAKFNHEMGTNIQLKKKSWKRIFSKV